MTLYVPKTWVNAPSTLTPITGPALTDLEVRATDYARGLAVPEIIVDTLDSPKTLDMTGRQNVIWKLTLASNSTISITGWSGGQAVTLQLRQDGTGNRVPTLPAALWEGGTPPTLSTGPGTLDIVTIYADYSAPPAYVDAVLADQPLAYYRLNEPSGITAADSAGAHTGTYINTPTLGVTAGLATTTDKAITLTAAQSERVQLDAMGGLGANSANASYEFWIKTTQSTLGTVFNGNNAAGCNVFVQINNGSAGLMALDIRSVPGPIHQIGSVSTNIYDGNWHHVVWVTQGPSVAHKCWVDGVQRTVTMSLNSASTPANFDNPMQLGASQNLGGGSPASFLDGSLDEVAFYTNRLTASQIAVHYAAAQGTPVGNTLGFLSGLAMA